jgi:hypothetical protein
MAVDNRLIERFLDTLIDPYQCVDTYGRSYIDDLELIVVENHYFDFASQSFPDAATQAWFKRVCSAFDFKTMEELISYVRSHLPELSISSLRPRSTFHTESTYEHEASFQDLRGKEDSVEKSLEFQRLWSLQSFDDLTIDDAVPYEHFMNYDRVNPWTYFIRREVRRGNLRPDDAVICIGNRWVGEIRYFREILGLKKAVGVDLFSPDPELVVAADMHKMPFADNSIKLIFNRGLINKSYDVRILIAEMLRVLTPGGYLIFETPGPYGWGVSRLGRTDIKSFANILRLLHGKVSRVIYADEVKPKSYTSDSVRLVRLFVKIEKNGNIAEPVFETIPKKRFAIYDKIRCEWILWRMRARRWLARANWARKS